MKILTIDIGTGTQDIFLYDSNLHIENGFKMVVPSPTMIIRRQIQHATLAKQPILIQGEMMGGGPSSWAVEDHLRTGLKVYATPLAAKTINDDLDKVRKIGVQVISEGEAMDLPKDIQRITFGDLNMPAITQAFENYGVDLSDLSAIAVGVFDHGDAPTNVSDRKFRFDYLDERIKAKNSLSTFAFSANNIPNSMTRLQTVGKVSSQLSCPMIVMDTAPSAIFGACFDPVVLGRKKKIIVNIGNFHTLAIRLNDNKIEGMFEHHTGEIDLNKLELLLMSLADGTLTNEDVYNDMGHGALLYTKEKLKFGEGDFDIVVTGPRRSLVSKQAKLRPYFAAPYGDMMIAGCFGLLAATGEIIPDLYQTIGDSMQGDGIGKPPWES